MIKLIWIARSANSNTDSMAVYDDQASALDWAKDAYYHLTERERRANTVSVESYAVEVPDGDTRTARDIYDWLTDPYYSDECGPQPDPDVYGGADPFANPRTYDVITDWR